MKVVAEEEKILHLPHPNRFLLIYLKVFLLIQKNFQRREKEQNYYFVVDVVEIFQNLMDLVGV